MKRDGEKHNGHDTAAMICVVENVSDDEVDKTTAAAVAWAWDSEAIRAARAKCRGENSLLLDFGGEMLNADELRRLELVLGKRVKPIQEPSAHAPWTQAWLATIE